MDERIEHRPAFQQGLVLHIGLILLNTAISGYLLYLAFNADIRGIFILYLIASVITYIPAPFLFYQAFALFRARYVISQHGIAIRWGLRTENIPISEIEWIRLPEDFVKPIARPTFQLPGAVLTSVYDQDLGAIEYIAAGSNQLILIATRSVIFAISPGYPESFINDFHRAAELGSFSPIPQQSTKPQLFIINLVKNKVVRSTLFISLLISLILLVTVSFLIPNLESVPLGLESSATSQEASPPERLILLPLLALLVFFGDLGYGAYLYRKEGFKNAAYIVFFSSLILPISFSILIIFIVL